MNHAIRKAKRGKSVIEECPACGKKVRIAASGKMNQHKSKGELCPEGRRDNWKYLVTRKIMES